MNHPVTIALRWAYRPNGYLSPIPPPVSRSDVEEVEQLLGFQLPPLLRELYLGVGNGGFGPSDGAIGIRIDPIAEKPSLVEVYNLMRVTPFDDRFWQWPRYLLPILDWGCAIKSCIDCRDAPYPVIRFDPNGHRPGTPWDSAFYTEEPSLDAWFEAWMKRIGVKVPHEG